MGCWLICSDYDGYRMEMVELYWGGDIWGYPFLRWDMVRASKGTLKSLLYPFVWQPNTMISRGVATNQIHSNRFSEQGF
jgi:hypothetical protein